MDLKDSNTTDELELVQCFYSVTVLFIILFCELLLFFFLHKLMR